MPPPTARSRFTIESFASIDSTSTELKRRAGAGIDIDRSVVVADTQTAGRGRLGRAWVDQPGGSLLFSLGWRAALPAAKLAGLSLAVGVAAATALAAQGIDALALKWPNDLLLRSRKLGGILIETLNARNGSIDVVIGIGINLKLDPAVRDRVDGSVIALSDAGWSGDRDALLDATLDALSPLLDDFPTHGFAPWRAAWLQRHAHHQRDVTLWRSGREIASGRAIDVDDDGALVLQTPAGVRRFTSGESTLRAR